MSITPSLEQKKVIKSLKYNNVVVDSIAGAGKTTTVIHICKKFSSKLILLLTYNSKLKQETKTKIDNNNINNIDVHTYHSYCYQYNNKCNTDSGIREVLENNDYIIKKKYDIIIIDEAQDMTPLYYSVIHSIFSKYSLEERINLRICILGDKRQSIYQFNNADSRYITLYNEIYKINNCNWIKCNLTTTYRLSENMVNFVNKCILKSDSLVYSNINNSIESVDYYLTSQYESKIIYNNIIEDSIKKYGISNVMIIAPSVKEKTPFKKLVNFISLTTKYPVYIPNSDDSAIDQKTFEKKLVFLTFHQSKGLERECVIVFGIDQSYNKYYNKNIVGNPNSCPNTIYVALTRAKKKLIILHDYSFSFLPFIEMRELSNYTNIKLIYNIKIGDEYKLLHEYKDFNEISKLLLNNYYAKKILNRIEELNTFNLLNDNNEDENNKLCYGVTKFISHLSSDTINHISKNYINTLVIKNKGDLIKTSSIISVNYHRNKIFEDVSNLNGIFVPFYYEYKYLNKLNDSNIIKTLFNLYCTKNFDLKIEIIKNLVDCTEYVSIIDKHKDIISNNNYIKYIYLLAKGQEIILPSIIFVYYDINGSKKYIIKNFNKQTLRSNDNSIVKNIHIPEKNVVNYKVFFNYFEYLFYKGHSKDNQNKNLLNYLNLKNNIKSDKKLNKSDLLLLSNIYNAYQTNYLNKLLILNKSKYKWFDKNELKKCMVRLNREIGSSNIIFEKNIESSISINNISIGLHGAIDCIVQNFIYEFKFVKEIIIEHLIQLLIYMFLYYNNHRNIPYIPNFYVYNIKTDEKIQIFCEYKNLKKLIEYIHTNKNNNNNKSDEEFINESLNIIKKLNKN